MSEPTPEKPEEPKRRDLTRAFNAIVRRPGEKKSVSGHIVTIGMAVVLAGAVAVGVGAIVFRPHAKPKPVAAADKRRSGSPSPSASPQAGGPQPPRTGPGVTGPDPVRQPPAGDPPGGHGKKKDTAGEADDPSGARVNSESSGTSSSGSARSNAKVAATVTTHYIVGNASHRCVDVAGGRAVNNNYTQIWDCRSGLNQQQWAFVSGTLRSMGMCLTATGSTGSALVVRACNGGSAQLFRHTSANDIVHSGTNTCVDVKDKKTAAGTRLQLWKCNGQANQKWRLS